jgi:hypothetical protein
MRLLLMPMLLMVLIPDRTDAVIIAFGRSFHLAGSQILRSSNDFSASSSAGDDT